MTFDEQGVLSRFHRALVREIHARNPDHVSSPFTVAEIYQNLVPYRTHRDELGVEMNADYEHALLRLLAGEGDYLTIESRTARKEIQEELDTPNPNTGLYRDFAAADVKLNAERLEVGLLEEIAEEVNARAEASVADEENDASGDDEVEEGGDEAIEAGSTAEDVVMEEEVMEEELTEDTPLEGIEEEDAAEVEYEPLEVEPLGASLVPPGEVDEELASDEVSVEVSGDVEDFEFETEEETEPVAEEAEADLPPFENCPWCREELPQQARVRFCPFCGSNVNLVPCPECGEELRLNWRFCIACGTEVKS